MHNRLATPQQITLEIARALERAARGHLDPLPHGPLRRPYEWTRAVARVRDELGEDVAARMVQAMTSRIHTRQRRRRSVG